MPLYLTFEKSKQNCCHIFFLIPMPDLSVDDKTVS